VRLWRVALARPECWFQVFSTKIGGHCLSTYRQLSFNLAAEYPTSFLRSWEIQDDWFPKMIVGYLLDKNANNKHTHLTKVICMEFKKNCIFGGTIFNMPGEYFFYSLVPGKTMRLLIQWVLWLSEFATTKNVLDAFTLLFNLENMWNFQIYMLSSGWSHVDGDATKIKQR